jgi:hypothetical protein
MTHTLQTRILKKFFKRWESLFSRRLGLQVFAATIEQVQMRSLFARANKLLKRNREVVQHMFLFREFNLCQRAMTGLRRHACRKELAQQRIEECFKMRQQLLLTRIVVCWR